MSVAVEQNQRGKMELAQLEEAIAAQGEKVKNMKAAGEDVSAEIPKLLALKDQLPEGAKHSCTTPRALTPPCRPCPEAQTQEGQEGQVWRCNSSPCASSSQGPEAKGGSS